MTISNRRRYDEDYGDYLYHKRKDDEHTALDPWDRTEQPTPKEDTDEERA